MKPDDNALQSNKTEETNGTPQKRKIPRRYLVPIVGVGLALGIVGCVSANENASNNNSYFQRLVADVEPSAASQNGLNTQAAQGDETGSDETQAQSSDLPNETPDEDALSTPGIEEVEATPIPEMNASTQAQATGNVNIVPGLAVLAAADDSGKTTEQPSAKVSDEANEDEAVQVYIPNQDYFVFRHVRFGMKVDEVIAWEGNSTLQNDVNGSYLLYEGLQEFDAQPTNASVRYYFNESGALDLIVYQYPLQSQGNPSLNELEAIVASWTARFGEPSSQTRMNDTESESVNLDRLDLLELIDAGGTQCYYWYAEKANIGASISRVADGSDGATVCLAPIQGGRLAMPAPQVSANWTVPRLTGRLQENEIAVELENSGRYISLAGTIASIKREADGRACLRFESSGEESGYAFRCYFSSDNEQDLIPLKAGNWVMIVGKLTELQNDALSQSTFIIFEECSVSQ